MENQYLKNIRKGMKVKILNSLNKYSVGFIDEVASRTPFHPDGIMVRLTNGEVGRVQSILSNDLKYNNALVEDLMKLIEKGEGYKTEFKAEALWSTTYSHQQIKESKSYELREYGQKASKVIIAKSIAAFLNSDGGNLILGIKEKKDNNKFEIVGIEEDLKKVKDGSKDGYRRIIIDEIIKSFFPQRIFNRLNNYIEIEFVEIQSKTVCWIKVRKSDSWVFLKVNDRDIFVIRVDSENRTLEGEKLVDYCMKKWCAK